MKSMIHVLIAAPSLAAHLMPAAADSLEAGCCPCRMPSIPAPSPECWLMPMTLPLHCQHSNGRRHASSIFRGASACISRLSAHDPLAASSTPDATEADLEPGAGLGQGQCHCKPTSGPSSPCGCRQWCRRTPALAQRWWGRPRRSGRLCRQCTAQPWTPSTCWDLEPQGLSERSVQLICEAWAD